jgi:nuclear transport factor 2 (NTF2) superfamily protein
MSRPPFPPFTLQTAIRKVRTAEDRIARGNDHAGPAELGS